MSNSKITETSMPPFPWQESAWKGIYDSYLADRIPHAILIQGMDGVGIELFAYALAKYLLCQAPLEDVACGRCKGCQLFSSQTHPDLFILKREEATQIKVDQVRSCVEFVNKTSHFERGKVVLIEEAELMNTSAANALLKSLEEPQGKCTFVLVTSKPSNLLATIHSRCQTIAIKVPPTHIAEAWLKDNKVDESALLLHLAGGAPLKSKQWAESGFLVDFESVCTDLLKLLNRQLGVIKAAQSWQKLGLEKLLELHTQILSMAIKHGLDDPVQPAGFEELMTQLEKIDTTLLFRLRDNFMDRVDQFRSFSNLNEHLAIEEIAMDWFVLSDILVKQDTLARRAARV